MLTKIAMVGTLFAWGLFGCAVPMKPKTKIISPVVLGNGSLENVAGDDDDCGWVLFYSTFSSGPELHYCCPGELGEKPVCREAEIDRIL